MKKRFLGIILTLTLCLCLLPAVSLTAAAAEAVSLTSLKIGGTAVDVGNLTTETTLSKDTYIAITGDSGTVTFTPATDTTPAKLTLNGATISSDSASGIEATGDLMIEVNNASSITSGTNYYAIDVTDGALTITGSGSLTVNNGTSDSKQANGSIHVSGDLTLDSESLTLNVPSLIRSGGNISITGGNIHAGAIVTATSGDLFSGVTSEGTGNISISGGTVTAGFSGSYSEGVTLQKGLTDMAKGGIAAGGDLSVTGGSVKAYGIAAGGDLTVNGQNVTAEAKKTAVAGQYAKIDNGANPFDLQTTTDAGGDISVTGGATLQVNYNSGTAYVTSTGTNYPVYVPNGNITVTGSTLNVCGKGTVSVANLIEVFGNFTMTNSTVSATATSNTDSCEGTAIQVGGDFKATGGSLTITSPVKGIDAGGNIDIDGLTTLNLKILGNGRASENNIADEMSLLRADVGKLSIKDVTSATLATGTVHTNIIGSEDFALMYGNEVEITNSNITANQGNNFSYGIFAINGVSITGGSVDLTNNGAVSFIMAGIRANGDVAIDNANVKAAAGGYNYTEDSERLIAGIRADKGKVTITNSEVTATATTKAYNGGDSYAGYAAGIASLGTTGGVEITNSDVTATGDDTSTGESYNNYCAYGILAQYGGIAINNTSETVIAEGEMAGIFADSGNISITTTGTVTVTAANGYYGVDADGAASFSGTGTVTATINANGVTIKDGVTVSAETSTGEAVKSGGALEVNGATLTAKSTSSTNGSYGVTATGSVTFTDATVTAEGYLGGVNAGGTLTISDSNSVINAKSTSASFPSSRIQCVGLDATGAVTIEGGTVNAIGGVVDYTIASTGNDNTPYGIGIRSGSTVTITGGTVTASCHDLSIEISQYDTISGSGEVSGAKSTQGYGIYATDAVTITGGTVNAYGYREEDNQPAIHGSAVNVGAANGSVIKVVASSTFNDANATVFPSDSAGLTTPTNLVSKDGFANLRTIKTTIVKSLSGAEVTVDALTYTGAAQTPTVTVKLDGTELTATTDYTVAYYAASDTSREAELTSVTNAGDYVAVITAADGGSYAGSVEKMFSVGKAALTITASDQTVTYGTEITNTKDQVTANGLKGSDALDSVTLTPSDSTVTTNGTITAKDAVIKNGGEDRSGNYTITYDTGKLTINPLEVTLTWDGTTARNYEAGKASNVTATVSNKVGSDDVSVTVTGGTETNAGTHTATATALTGAAAGNYKLPADPTTTYAINKIQYNGTIGAVTKVVDVTGTEQTVSVDISSVLSDIEGATVSSAVEGTDANNIISAVTGSGKTVSITVTSTAADTNTATVTATISSTNYKDIGITITVNVKELADASVTITGTVPNSLTYGAADFTLTATAANPGTNGVWSWISSDPDVLLVTGDGANATVKVVRASDSAVTITASYASDTTIGEASTAGTTVAKANLTVKPKNLTITAGDAMPTPTEVEYSGFVNGEDASVVTAAVTDLNIYAADGTTPLADTNTAGTYIIKLTGTFTATNYNVTIENGTLTINKKSSGGGGGTPPTTSVTVPISGDEETINVDASVSGSKATVDDVDLSKLDTVIGEDVDTGVVTIDFSGLNKSIDTVEIPADVVKQISEAVNNPNNDAESLEVVLSDGTSIEFDAVALGEKSAQANGLDITISIKSSRGTGVQQSVVGNRTAYDINVTSGGKAISDMGGMVTVHAPYELKSGEIPRGVVVYYIDENGNEEACETSYDSVRKRVNWRTDHLSLYMIGYDEELAESCDGGESCPSATFTDLDTSLWYHEYTDFVIENGLMQGTSTTEKVFSPNGIVSRAQVVTVLWRLEGEPVVNYAMTFEDVEEGLWYSEAVRWAASEGIVEGWNNKYAPNDAVTREQLATILWRYAKYKGYDVSIGENTNILSYTDAESISEYAVSAIQWANGIRMMEGYNGQLNPLGGTKRSEFAKMITVFIESVTAE